MEGSIDMPEALRKVLTDFNRFEEAVITEAAFAENMNQFLVRLNPAWRIDAEGRAKLCVGEWRVELAFKDLTRVSYHSNPELQRGVEPIGWGNAEIAQLTVEPSASGLRAVFSWDSQQSFEIEASTILATAEALV
jgi:hypothetical protein